MKVLADRIRSSKRILMSTHKDPDGDGIGAMLALSKGLRSAGKQVELYLPDPCPQRFLFLDPDHLLRDLPEDAKQAPWTEPDLALIIDTHQWSLLGRVGELLQEAGTPTVFLDHHPVQGVPRPDVFGDPNSSSTGEIVYRLMLFYLDLPIDAEIGACLYTSIAYDTHSFRYVRNSPSPHLIAADLLSRGVNATEIYRHLFASNPAGKMRLLGQILRGIQIEADGRLAWAVLPNSSIVEHDCCPDDLRDAVNYLLEFDGVEVAVLLKEVEKGLVKVSLRSKGKIEVHEAAAALGGGGHPFAAGATLVSDLDRARERVLTAVLPVVRNGRPSGEEATVRARNT
ncbi:MAG: bifunctional oligoribonuclease/PAP phosphatase NrnA [Candidatus Eisenbacteria bacterium]|nr:DHHA1 domain-containing protein [Candidatus Eisenbacteria bacterium]